MASLRYVVADVFTDTPLTGNQLAVFTDGQGIDTETMQALVELRLLRVFRELQDNNSRRVLIQLAEQIVKRQAAPPDNAG